MANASQTAGYLPSRSGSPAFDRYQILLLGVRTQGHMCVNKLTEVVTWSETAGSRTSDIYA